MTLTQQRQQKQHAHRKKKKKHAQQPLLKMQVKTALQAERALM